jgi:NTE family protein
MATGFETVGSPLFDGLSRSDVAALVRALPRVRFAAGSAVVVEGDSPHGLYVVVSGTALLQAAHDDDRAVIRFGPGAVIGEVSLLTGQPVSATVRAHTDVEVIRWGRDEFATACARHPGLVHNVAAILAGRLRVTTRRAQGGREPSITLLRDRGAPPLLGFALAASVAWHVRAPVMFVATRPPGEGADAVLATFEREPVGEAADGLTLLRPAGSDSLAVFVTAPADLDATGLARLLSAVPRRQSHVLVQAPAGASVGEDDVLDLSGSRNAPGSWGHIDGARVGRGIDVPRPDAGDTGALRGGLLAPKSAAGQALGSVARLLARLRVGVALGAGAEKGYAHLGVLRVLREVGVPIDAVAGTSIGAAVAFLAALGVDLDEATDAIDTVAARTMRFGIPAAGVLSSAGLRSGLQAFCGRRRIEDTPIPLGIVAADLGTRSEVIFRDGLVWPALLASMSIPGVYPPQCFDGRVLVDGGVINPVPSSVAALLGADVVIAVRLGHVATHGGPAPASASPPGRARRPSMARTVLRSVEIMQRTIASQGSRAASIVIEPGFDPADGWGGLRRFSAGRRYVEHGAVAARAALPRARAVLPWLTHAGPG